MSIHPLPVGRSILRRLIREEDVDIAVENVGHFYVRDFFKTDSGAFSIVIMLYWISLRGKLSMLREFHPDGNSSQSHSAQVENQDEVLQKIIDEIIPHFSAKKNKKIEVDGIRYEFFDGDYLASWFAMRRSGYEKIEKFYFGSLHDEDFQYLQEKLKQE